VILHSHGSALRAPCLGCPTQVFIDRQEVIQTMNEQWLAAHPAVLVWHFEQKRSARDAMEKETKEEERRKAAIEEALAKRLDKLEVSGTSSSSNSRQGQESHR
jgi:hypothetical protein